MIKIVIILLYIGTTLFGQFTQINYGGGPTNRENINREKCISEQERSFVREHRIEVDHGAMRDTVLFQDSMGSGGMQKMIMINQWLLECIYTRSRLESFSKQKK